MSNEALVQRIADAVLMVVDQRDWSDWSDWSTSTCRVALADALRPVLASSDEAAVNYQTTTDRSALSAPEAEAVAWASEQHVMLLAIDLASEEFDDPHEVLYEGFPPEPWGSAWQRFEGEAKRMIERVTAIVAPAHSEQAAVPEGFVLVPKEPTQAMVDAGEGCPQAPWIITSPTSREKELHCITQYRAMLAAAPSAAPAVKESLTVAGAGWIPVSERLPDCDCTTYLGIDAAGVMATFTDITYRKDNGRHYAYDESDGEFARLALTSEITHWQPLPAAPAATKEG